MLVASEDAQATREEVETVNEEFQATNEELETLNEELTASVEELRVANEDLATRTAELSAQTVALEQEKLSLEEEHDRLRSILASLGDAIVAVDHEGRVVMTNAAYDRLFGTATADMEPEDAAGLPHSAGRPAAATRRPGRTLPHGIRVAPARGTRRWFEAIAEPLTAGDRTWGGVIAIRDLSERTMRLSLERLMAAAGHELKTPVAALHGYLQLVERHLGPDSSAHARTYVSRALVQTRQVGELVERLFDVSRIQTGGLELVVEMIDLAEVVRDAAEVVGALPTAPMIRVSAAHGPIPLEGDAGRLEQVFVNLLANAVEYAATSPTIDVTVRRYSSDRRGEGRGSRAGDRRRRGAPPVPAVYRLAQKRSAGLGLGLYLAREIVLAHGGTIEAGSTPGGGTTISVRLPLGKPKRKARPAAKARP